MSSSKLETAIRAGDLDKVRELIAAGVDVSAAFANGTTPIQLAAKERQITILRALAAAGAVLEDLKDLNFEERLALFVESSLDSSTDDDLMDADELSAWAEQAAGEAMDPKLAAEIAASEGKLFRAIRTGDLELLKERIAAGDDIDPVREITRDTPLTRALHEGNEEMARELIRAGANVNHSGFSTPLSFALPSLRLVKLLIDAGADVHARGLDHQSALERAVHRALSPSSSEDSPLLVRFFLEAGVHPQNAESCDGTLLLEAELGEAWELYQELLPHYSEEIARESFEELEHEGMREDDGGRLEWSFELRQAAREGDAEELRAVLARRQGDIAKEMTQALKEALTHLHLKAVRVLIDAGVDFDAAERYQIRRGSSPLALAAESWHRQSAAAMRLLLKAGADVDQRGSYDRTPLMYAVLLAYRHGAALRKAVPILLDAGADPNLEDEFGLTAWSLAKAPLIEAEERDEYEESDAFFGGTDLSELFSDSANKTDRRRERLDRCREALERVEAAGAVAHGEAELRLMIAAIAGDTKRVRELLATGADSNARGPDGKTAIVAAAEIGSNEIVGQLIAAGCDVDARLPGTRSALEIAVRSADETMTRRLLDAGANVVMMVAMSSGCLAAAEEAGGSKVVEMIRGSLPPQLANIDRDVAREIEADDKAYEGQRELPRQAAFGDLEKVRELLAVEGVEVDGFDALRRTALMAAAEAGRHEAVRELLAAGAAADKCNGVVGSPRSTPLACAAISSSAERDDILRLLLEAGADPDQLGADDRTALMHAVERDIGFFGRTGEFALSTRTLIAAGADLEIRDPYGLTAWMRAMSLASSIEIEEVAQQYEAIARLLEKAGASTAGLSEVRLVWAVEVGEDQQVRELLAAGTDANAHRHDGATALMLAVRDSEVDIARLLIEAGCDVNARQWVERGPSALSAATEASARQLAQLLVDAGAIPIVDRGRHARSVSPIRKE